MQHSFIRFAPSSFIAERYSLFSYGESTGREDTIVIKDEETEKVYFDRLMTDLEQGITYSTFHNSQLANVSYRNKFYDKTTCASRDSVDSYEDYIEFTEPYHFASHKMKIPLIESALEGNKDIVNLLIKMKCDIDETDKFGRSALFITCLLGREDVAILLLDKNANHELTDNNDRSPLYVACKGGFLPIVNALLTKSADLNTSDKNGCCALHAACETGHKK
ncbi:ANK [Mytilus edulis]|uniref:ANK n=1 Tax=Mytilus edulis TaxID=6550 RepID=A0A8S3URI4_MYTED|nr:ANK [Mytilus edulis]